MARISGLGSGIESIAKEHASATIICPPSKGMFDMDVGFDFEMCKSSCGLPLARSSRTATEHTLPSVSYTHLTLPTKRIV